MLTEKEIVEGCKKGNPAAQEALYHTYCSRMKMICLRYVRHTSEADDLFHESLIKVFSKIHSYKGEGSLAGWIRTITVHTAIDHYHKENKIKKTRDRFLSDDTSEDDAYDDQFTRMAQELQVDDLLNIINKLPAGYRMIFNLYAIENYSHKEIGSMLNISEGTSKSQLSKARKQLKEWILNYCLIENEGRIK